MRALARWGFTPLLASPLTVSALGLGDIELKSALNQPLQAEIALVSATPEELEGLRIALATRETFARYGLDRPEYLSNLQFRLDRDAAGRNIIRVTSRESIAEPFVTMLIEATWPRGRLLREYTVLLDPPVLLPQPQVATALSPASTRAPDGAAGGTIARPTQPSPAQSASAPRGADTAAPAPRPAVAPGGTYGPVQRAETLWGIANSLRPAGVSVNQMMVALYEANAAAFDGNMNRLLQGAVLRVPELAELERIPTAAANAEVQRQNEAWASGVETARLRLLPADDVGDSASPAAGAAGAGASGATVRSLQDEVSTLRSQLEESQRLLALRDQELRQLQERLAAAEAGAAALPAPAAEPASEPDAVEPVTAAGVDLEEEIFADEEPAATEPAAEPVAEAPAPVETVAPAPAATQVVTRPEPEPSLLSRALGWIMNPVVLIALGVAALLLAVVGFMRRRREEEPEDVTGRWDALEEEIQREQEHEETARLRRHVPDDGFVVEEQGRRPRVQAEPQHDGAAAAGAALGGAAAAASTADETLSTQTVIDLDQADPVAEADFHMAYGLYDQAAELISKALEQNPGRRDLTLKLLDVYFVWGNKEGFLTTAEALRREIGSQPDADWDKVVIMGKQICPDSDLFADATAGAPAVDLDLEAGSSPALDLAFEDESTDGASLGFDSSTDDTAEDLAFSATTRRNQQLQSDELDDSLDIGASTAAGLEAALLEPADDDDPGERTLPDADADSLAVTQESPTVERPGTSGLDWDALSIDSPTGQAEAPTVETPTIESLGPDAPTMETPTVESLGPDAPTMETPTVETAFWGDEPATVERQALGGADDGTAEIDLDDLGLDLSDLESLPADLGELPSTADGESDTREQPKLGTDSDVLSATGVTQVLSADVEELAGDAELEQRETAVLADDDATLLASLDEDTLGGTEVLDERYRVEATGETSLVESLGDNGLDLNLDDLSAALQSGGDTVEQPRAFDSEVFGGNGGTPLDLDVGIDVLGADDPTGTEDLSPLDPQTMTEVGTKLDLARAYIDMGDPEGARSILEEVLDEGDSNQRREAQSLIETLAS